MSSCTPTTTKTWQGALDYVVCLNTNQYLGYNDWRLPNMIEIFSLFDHSKYSPALPTGHPFLNVQLFRYWSSTTFTGSPLLALMFDMVCGEGGAVSKSESNYVWPVRSEEISFIQDLVTKYYNDVLDRSPEPGGAEYWTSEIERIVSLGIDVMEGFQALAKFFLNSEEYGLQNKTDEQFVTDLYQTFLNRAPDPDGFTFWVNYLAQGLTRNMLISQFAY